MFYENNYPTNAVINYITLFNYLEGYGGFPSEKDDNDFTPITFLKRGMPKIHFG